MKQEAAGKNNVNKVDLISPFDSVNNVWKKRFLKRAERCL